MGAVCLAGCFWLSLSLGCQNIQFYSSIKMIWRLIVTTTTKHTNRSYMLCIESAFIENTEKVFFLFTWGKKRLYFAHGIPWSQIIVIHYLFPFISSTAKGEKSEDVWPSLQDELLCTHFMQFDFELFSSNGTLIAPPFHLSEPEK